MITKSTKRFRDRKLETRCKVLSVDDTNTKRTDVKFATNSWR